ncbi:MAG: ChbG/HpnK family deacetylase [Planctomycetes bacterium]|nr:ChbG/HpnK family deacetylase [Planctomycetota bacterium]
MTFTPLVINADDAGLDPEVDAAILEGARAGLISSASVVATGPTAADFVAAAKELGLGLGLHLNLSEGRPLATVPSLVDDAGFFHHPKDEAWRRAADGRFDRADLIAEIAAQLRALDDLGVVIDHVDSHNHIHCYEPVLDALLAVLAGRSLHLRVPCEPECPDDLLPAMPEVRLAEGRMRTLIAAAGCRSLPRFVGHLFAVRVGDADVDHLEREPRRACEWMVHPGVRAGSAFTESPLRARELGVLADPELRRRLERWGYRRCRFGELG